MRQVLHGSARTTEAIRRAIRHSQASIRALAGRYGINPKTVAKWKRRHHAADAPIAVHCAALVGHGCETNVAFELSAIVDGAIEHLACQHAGEVLAHDPDAAKGGNLATGVIVRLGYSQPLVALGLNLSDQLQRQH